MPREDTLTILRNELADLLAAENVPHGAACAVTEKFIERLQQRCGGDRLFVPKIDRDKRDAAILADWRAGMTVGAIAERQGVATKTVYNIINRRSAKRAPTDIEGGFGRSDWEL